MHIYAIRDASNLEEIEVALPADTWTQPTLFSSTEPDAQILVDALHKFESVSNSDQSQTDGLPSLRQLIFMSTKSRAPSVKEAVDRILPLVKSFEFQLTDAKGTAVFLSEVRSILQCIGQHISELGVTFRMDKYPKYTDRYYQKICQYVGPQLKTLSLSGVPSNQGWLIALKPLLCRIECFSLQTSNYDFEYDIDFELYCPNVKTLNIYMNLKGTLLSRKQPKLEKLSMLYNQFMEEALVLEFMKNNPQLVHLKIQANDSNNFLKQIPLHLPKLEHLCLHQGYPNITAENLEHLTVMKQLKSLELMDLDEEDFNGILNCLPKFRQLEALQLHLAYDGPDDIDLEYVFKPNFDLIVTLAQELPQLKRFHLRYCQIVAETLQNFIRYATNLEIFTFNGCGLEITDTILENIATSRQGAGAATMVLYADKIHPELNREKMYSAVKLVSFDMYKP
ncbi:hypothetical protein HA402_013384 [Bradysia odoriphaga]|nr:hypothetical protein HA402_013384 [Bradysia odoriphaga]